MDKNESHLPLSKEEIDQAASLLRRLPKGFLPYDIFIQVARLVTTPTMEVAPIRMREGKLEIYLTKRSPHDLHWPSSWHIPGTVIRSTDDEGNFTSGFKRVLDDELGPAFQYVSDPQLVYTKFWDVLRGRELDMVHYIWVEVNETTPINGAFFQRENIPESTIEHHKIMIPEIFATIEGAIS